MPFLAPILGAIGAAVAGVVGAFGAGGAFGAVGAFLGKMLASVALSLLARAIAGKPKQPGIRTDVTQSGGVNPASFILGKYATGGTAVCPPMAYGMLGGGAFSFLGDALGAKPDVPNEYLVYVIDVGDIPGGNGLMDVIIDGEKVTLGAEQFIPAQTQWVYPPTYDPEDPLSPQSYEDVIHPAVSRGRVGTGTFAGKLWVKFKDGTDTVVDPYLLRVFENYPERPWTSDMIGTGVPHVIVTMKFNRERYSGFPACRFVVGGIPLYDPRADSSVGGSGAQRWANRATWVSTENPAVQVYNILRGITLPDGSTWGGRAAADDLPLPVWTAAMNAADVTVSLSGGGSEPAYRASFEVTVDDEPKSVIDEILRGCSGVVAEVGGEWRIRLGPPSLPVFFLSDDDIIISKPQDLEPFPSLDQTFNGISISYPDPASNWEPRNAPPRYNATWEASDNGRRLIADLSLPATPYADQVQRVGEAYINDQRRFRVHTQTLPPDAMTLEPLDVVSWDSTRNGYVGKLFELATTTVDLMTGAVFISSREVDPADHDWTPDMTIPNPAPSVLPVVRAAITVKDWNALGGVVKDEDDDSRRPAIDLYWDATPTSAVKGIQWEIRLADGTSLRSGSTQSLSAGFAQVSEGVLPDTAYQARARWVADTETEWTEWVGLSTIDVRLGTKDIATDILADITASQQELADMVGIKYVTTLPAAGEKPDQIVMLPNGDLRRWDDVNSEWTRTLFGGIKPGDVEIASFAAGIEPVTIVAGGTLPVVKSTETITFGGKLYRWNGTAYSAAVPSVDVTGQMSNAQIADAAITNDKLGANSVTSGKIADSAVSASKIVAKAISATKFADGIEPVTIATGSLPVAKSTEAVVFGGKLYRWGGTAYVTTVPSTDISGQITSAQIDSLDAAKLAGTMSPDRIGTGALLSAKLADAAITGVKIADNAITAGKIFAGSVTSSKIATDAIKAIHVEAGAIVAGKLAVNSVIASNLLVIGNNLVANPTFKDGSAGWVAGTNPGLQATIDKVYSVDATNAPTPKVRQYVFGPSATPKNISILNGEYNDDTMIPFTPGEKIFGSIDAAASTSAVCTLLLLLIWKYQDGTAHPGATVVSASPTTSWTTYTGEITVPANVIGAWINVYSSGHTATAYWTRATLKRKDGADLIVDGTLVARHIASDAITTAKIAAGAVTAAEIAAGAVSTGKLNVGFDGNLLVNSDLSQGLSGLVTGGALNMASSVVTFRPPGVYYSSTAFPILSVAWSGTLPSTGYFDVNFTPTGLNNEELLGAYPVTVGQFYEFSVQSAVHRHTLQTWIRWLGNDGLQISATMLSETTTDWGDPDNPMLWPRRGGIAQAPTGAVYGRPFLRFKDATAVGGVSLFLHKPFFARTVNATAELRPYSNGGQTVIDGGSLVTGSIFADKIAAGAITTDKMAVGSVTADRIAVQSITASKLLISGGNLIDNHDFRTGDFSGWRPFGSVDRQQIVLGSTSRDGANAPTLNVVEVSVAGVAVNVTTFSGYKSYMDPGSSVYRMPMVPGERVRMTIDAVVQTGSSMKITPYLFFQERDGTITGHALAAPASVTNSWATYAGEFVVPANVVGAWAYIYCDSFVGSGKGYWSNVTVKRMDAANLIVSGGIVAAKIATDAVTADKIAANAITSVKILAGSVSTDKLAANAITTAKLAAGAVTADQMAVNSILAKHMVITAQGTALNSDPNLEDISAWNISGAGSFTIETILDGPSGNRAIRGVNGAHVRTSRFAVEQNKKYRLRAHARRSAVATSGLFYLRAYFTNSYGASLGYKETVAGSYLAATWTAYDAILTAPGFATECEIYLICNYSGGATGYHEVQAIRMEEAVEANLIVDGTITAGKIATNAITADKILAGAIVASKMAAGSITAANAAIADLAVDRIKLAAGAISAFDFVQTPITFDGKSTWATDTFLGSHNITLSGTDHLCPERVVLRPRLSGFFPGQTLAANSQFGCYFKFELIRKRSGVADLTLKSYLEPFWQMGFNGSSALNFSPYAGNEPNATLYLTRPSFLPGDTLEVKYYYHRFRTGSVNAWVEVTSIDLEIEEFYR